MDIHSVSIYVKQTVADCEYEKISIIALPHN